MAPWYSTVPMLLAANDSGSGFRQGLSQTHSLPVAQTLKLNLGGPWWVEREPVDCPSAEAMFREIDRHGQIVKRQ